MKRQWNGTAVSLYSAAKWLKVLRRPAYAPRRLRAGLAVQPPLFA